MAWGGGGGGFQVSTVSYLNPSCIKLELGLGYAHFLFTVGLISKRGEEKFILSKPSSIL